jgi:hypothetical protein
MAEIPKLELKDNLNCKNCRSPLESSEFKFCPHCGVIDPVAIEVKKPTKCPSCGTALKEDYIFCPGCGSKNLAGPEKAEVIQTVSPKKEAPEPQPSSSTAKNPALGDLDMFVTSFSTKTGLHFGSPKQYVSSEENLQMKPGTFYQEDESKVAVICPHDSVLRNYTLEELPLKSLKMIDRKGHSYVGLNLSYIEQKYLEAYIKTCFDFSPSTDVSKLRATVKNDSKFYIGLVSDVMDCYIAPSDFSLQENKVNEPSAAARQNPTGSTRPSYCDNCGNKLRGQELFCGKCGTRVGTTKSYPNGPLKK